MRENRSLASKIHEYMRAQRLRNQASRTGDVDGVYFYGDNMKYWGDQLDLEIEAGMITKDVLKEWLNSGIQPS